MKEQENDEFPPELAWLLTPEYRREKEEKEREMMEARIRAEIHLENARKILEGLNR